MSVPFDDNLTKFGPESEFSTYQHGGPEVVLLLELGDEHVDVHDLANIHLPHVSDDVHQPLETSLSSGHPDEIYLENR